MDSLSYKTKAANKALIKKAWKIVNADGKVLGRMASEVAKIIRGKHKPYFTPNVDCGDNVIVINSNKVKLTGKKWTNKVYVRHTGYPGGQKKQTPLEIKNHKSSTILIERAVRGMLPKNKIGRVMFKNLYVYAENEHPHEAQKANELNF